MKKGRIVLIVVFATLVICGIILLVSGKPTGSSKKTRQANVTTKISSYGYELLDTDTAYYKELFNKLKNVLESETPDEELYATLVSQLFVTDFYTLSNKFSSSDVGGVEFVSSEYKDNFALKARDTIYKVVESNLYDDRDQKLPTVTKVSIDDISKVKYSTVDTNAYSVKCSVTYEEDLDYPKVVKLILIHNDKFLEIAKIN